MAMVPVSISAVATFFATGRGRLGERYVSLAAACVWKAGQIATVSYVDATG